MPNKANEIEQYLISQMFSEDLLGIYTTCKSANSKYTHIADYFFTDTDREHFIMLASAWSAILRKAYRIFVLEKRYEPFSCWNAFIKVAILRQNLLLDDIWKKRFKNEEKEKLLKMIRKTSNPRFIERMFTGFNWNQLLNELNKYSEKEGLFP